jgi:murein DD-endopeptidase MepM/ murein hydrolase activator NlpD
MKLDKMPFMRILRMFFGLVLLLAACAAAAYYFAGRAAGPSITIKIPPVVGQGGVLDVFIDTPGGQLDNFTANVEQSGHKYEVLALSSAPPDAFTREGPDRLHVSRPIGKKALPDLRSGPAKVTVSATRPVLRGLRHVSSEATQDIQIRLDPPRLSVVSTHHYINVGGTETVVYRVTPPDAESGVRVGDITYPGFAASGAGVTGDPNLKVAFFALLYNQKPDTLIELYARDGAGNEARTPFDHQVFNKKFRSSKIPLDNAFLSRVVPAILQQSPELKASADDVLPAFLTINNDLRRINNEKIAALSKKTSPQVLWHGAFQPLGGAQVESAFADFRTYVYGGKDVDRQVHLGFDLAKTANSPVSVANDGKVLYASDLGIYGNCVIVDHGMGVQSLYGHLSSFDVREGQDVKKGQVLGKSGQTGLAGGDHLHFSMMIDGHFVNATEWWDPHWVEDRIMRKLRDAGHTGTASTP